MEAPLIPITSNTRGMVHWSGVDFDAFGAGAARIIEGLHRLARKRALRPRQPKGKTSQKPAPVAGRPLVGGEGMRPMTCVNDALCPSL